MNSNMTTEQLLPLLWTYGAKIIYFAIGLLVTWTLAKWLQALVKKSLAKAKVDIALQIFLSKLVRWAVLCVGIITCLGLFGIQTASFAAILAAAGFAVGMALQGTLGNFASGVMLLIFRPFKVGDVVSAAGQTGKVVEIDIFSTVFDTPDNRRIIIPNGSVFGGTIENISHHATRRVDVAVGTDYGADLSKTREVLNKAIAQTNKVLKDPASAVVLSDLGDSCINWSVRVWVDANDYWPVKDQLTESVKTALDQADIGIPFPQMDVHLDK